MSTVISIEEVSKLYRLGEVGTGSLAHDVNRWWHRVSGKEDPYLKVGESNDRTSKSRSDYVYAVKDVSFDVKQGDALGIIGRNGAGKSTLLKILSRVTTPTTGQIKIKGRIASLLEVGTGFHPELTGRENIYLNGAILGMSHPEIRANFDEIVAFSGCERYIDTPVKRYSSGMYVRLAFAVAAHLEPEILIIDEVLAVGDAEFQKKCLGKMKDVAGQGRTVLFVSHNMTAVAALCNKVVWLDEGKVRDQGNTRYLIDQYAEGSSHLGPKGQIPVAELPRTGTGAAKFTKLVIKPGETSRKSTKSLCSGDAVDIQVEILSNLGIKDANVAVTLYDMSGYRIVDVNTALKGEFLTLEPGARATVVFSLCDLLLKPAMYTVELWIGRGGLEEIDWVKDAGLLEINDNVGEIRHAETFPGTYQCKFTQRITK